MINIANINSCNGNFYENFYQIVKKTGIIQKISDLGKSVFNYCNRYQNALHAFTWYCLFIEVGSFTFDATSRRTNYNLDTCQDLICHLWNTTTENRHLFSPYTVFRCNPSNPNYHPFYFLEKCMSDLCEYAKKVHLNFGACISYNNSLSKDELDFSYELWNALCPKKTLRHGNLVKEATYINSCIASLCNYINTFEVKVETDLSDLCKNINTENLNELLDRLSKLIHNSEKKLQEDDSWTRANTVTSIIASVATIAVSTIATITTIITYRLTKPTNPAPTNTPTVLNGLRDIIRGLHETTQGLGNVELPSSDLSAGNVAINNLLSEVRSLLSEVSEVVEHSISYDEPNVVRQNQASSDFGLEVSGIDTGIGVGSLTSGEAGGVGTLLSRGISGLNIIFSESGKRFRIITNSSEIEEKNTTSVFLNKSDSVVQEKSDYFISHDYDNTDDTKRYIQYFINDLINYSFEGFNVTVVQANRLKERLESWQNAVCYYREKLFCRFPLAVHNNEPIIYVPDHYMDYIISKDLTGLCYYLLDNLWCNWSKFVEILSGTTYSIDNSTDCHWDYLFLKIQQNAENITEYKMEAIGECYNQTTLLKV